MLPANIKKSTFATHSLPAGASLGLSNHMVHLAFNGIAFWSDCCCGLLVGGAGVASLSLLGSSSSSTSTGDAPTSDCCCCG